MMVSTASLSRRIALMLCGLLGLLQTGALVPNLRPAGQRRLLFATVELDAEAKFSTRLALVEALKGVVVKDGDIVSAGMVSSLSVSANSIGVELELPRGFDETAADNLAAQCEAVATATRDALAKEGMVSEECWIEVVANVGRQESESEEQAQSSGEAVTSVPEAIRRVKRIVAVSSCKGGVGKSTVATNLAFALASKGFKVGIVDADVHGPSLPTLVGEPDVPAPGEQYVRLAEERDEWNRELLLPLEKAGVKLMSFGFLSGDSPAMMRGSRVAGVVQQLATAVAWRELDYLVVDMPPGTGDAQLTLCQQLNIDAAIVVTTPSRLAFADVVKGVKLFDEVSVPVVAVVENMAAFELSTNAAHQKAVAFLQDRRHLFADPVTADQFVVDLENLLAAPSPVFGEPHSRKLKEMWGIDHAFQLPLARDIAARSDSGVPLHLIPHTDLSRQEAKAKAIIDDVADAVLLEISRVSTLEPPEIRFDGVDIRSTFAGRTEVIRPRDLRMECRCAACVDEQTGSTNPFRAPVPVDVKPLSISRTGNYAVSIAWSDGHQSLYPYKSFVAAYRDALSASLASTSPSSTASSKSAARAEKFVTARMP